MINCITAKIVELKQRMSSLLLLIILNWNNKVWIWESTETWLLFLKESKFEEWNLICEENLHWHDDNKNLISQESSFKNAPKLPFVIVSHLHRAKHVSCHQSLKLKNLKQPKTILIIVCKTLSRNLSQVPLCCALASFLKHQFIYIYWIKSIITRNINTNNTHHHGQTKICYSHQNCNLWQSKYR